MLTRYIYLLFISILRHSVTPISFCISTLIQISKLLKYLSPSLFILIIFHINNGSHIVMCNTGCVQAFDRVNLIFQKTVRLRNVFYI